MLELDGDDLRAKVEEVHVIADPDTRMHPQVTFVLQPGAVEVEIEDAEGVVDVGQATTWLASSLEGLDFARFAAESKILERSDGVTPEEAAVRTLAVWLRRGAIS